MKGNEKGFTYPLVLCLLIVFLAFFSLLVERLLTERKQAHETSVLLQEEFYFLSSVKKVENMLQSGGQIPAKGTINFQNGKADFQADSPAGYLQKVQFTLRLNSGETMNGKGFIDTRLKRFVKWAD
jgi:hypothetical protein